MFYLFTSKQNEYLFNMLLKVYLYDFLQRAEDIMGNYIEVNDKNFETEVLKSDIPVLVDFWAPWCGPCRMVTPIVEEIATEYKDKIKVCKLNTDDSSEIAMKYQIVSIPTLAIFKNGKEVKRQVGALNKPALKKFIDTYAF